MSNPSPSYGNMYAAAVVAIWSGFILVSRAGGTSLLTAWDIIAVRYATASLVLLAIWRWRRLAASFEMSLSRTLTLAATGGLGYAVLVFAGFERAPATHAAVLLPGLLPFEVALFAWWLVGEKPTRYRWIGLGSTALGVGCFAIGTLHAGDSKYWLGDLFLVGASLCWALYTVLTRLWQADPWAIATRVAGYTAVIYLPFYMLVLPKHLTVAPVSMIALQALYQGVLATVVQMVLYIRSVALIGAMRMGHWMALVPVLAGLAAVPVLDEALSGWTVAALVCVSAGVWIGNRQSKSVQPDPD